MKFKIGVITVLVFTCFTAYGQTWNSVKADKLYQNALKDAGSNHTLSAIGLLEKATVLDPSHIDAQVLLAKLYTGNAQYDKAIKTALYVINVSPKYEDVYYYLIGSYLNKKDDALALIYADRALKLFPDNKDFAIKRLELLDLLNQYRISDDWTVVLLKKYPEDKQIRLVSSGHYEAQADWYLKKNNITLARKNYDLAISLNPDNKDIADKQNKMLANGGDYEAKLALVNQGLNINPKSQKGLEDKLGLLEEMKRYAEALDVLKILIRYYPNDKKAQKLNATLRIEAASYYQNTNAYELYQSILEQDPNNKDALNKVINLATAKGESGVALYSIERALIHDHYNVDLLAKKMGLEFEKANYVKAAITAEGLYRLKSAIAIKNQALEVINACGNFYLAQQQPDSAIRQFNTVLKFNDKDLVAIKGKINSYAMLNHIDLVLSQLDLALAKFPGNKELLIKKASFLAQVGRVIEACQLTAKLYQEDTSDKQLAAMYLEQQLAAANISIANENYDVAKLYLDRVLKIDPSNRDAQNYMINLLDYTKQYPQAIEYIDRALYLYPNDKDLLLKKVSVLFNSQKYYQSAIVSELLHQQYPFNKKYTVALTDSWLSAGQVYEKQQLIDSALYCYDKALAQTPKDSLASFRKLNILIERWQFNEALTFMDNLSLIYDHSEPLLSRKVTVLDSLKQYPRAAAYADTLNRLYPHENYADQSAFLKSKTFSNELGLSFLHSSFSGTGDGNDPLPYTYASIMYKHLTSFGSYGGNFLFTGRQNGTGIMGEAELSYKHSNKLYSDATLGFSNGVILPSYRVSYSLFKTFKNGVEVELGTRYLKVDSIRSFSLVGGASRMFGDFWVNIRAFGIKEEHSLYAAFNSQARYYLSDKDFINATVGFGTSPDDRSRLVLFPQLAGVLSKTIGAGYQKTINYRTTLGLSGALTNQKVTTTTFQNQYDVFLLMKIKF